VALLRGSNRLRIAVALVIGLAILLSSRSTALLQRQEAADAQAATAAAAEAAPTKVAGATLDAQGEPAPRPNILLIVADDQAQSTFNRTLMPTVFREIVDKGIRFDRQYVASSVCCPSRAETLTGLYETNSGVDHNWLPIARPTIADALKLNGYRTAIAGKFLNSHPCGTRRSEYNLWVCQGNDGSSYSLVNPKLNVNGTWVQRTGVAPDILANYLKDFIAATPKTQPFFAFYSPTTPHEPADDPRYASLPVTPPRPPSFDEDTTAAGKPAYTRTAPLDALLTATVDDDYTRMARSVRGLDDSVKILLDSLGDRADNTLVVYTSDNGYMYGEHRGRFKEAAYEEAVNTPFVVRYPQAIPSGLVGSTSHALVQNVDLTPTFADQAGFPWRADGKSLMPVLTDGASKVRDAALIQHCMGASYPCGIPRPSYTGVGVFRPTSFNGVVEQRWKYVAYENGDREVYDLTADPRELHNLAGTPSVAAEQTRLAGQLAALTARPTPDTTILFSSTSASSSALKDRTVAYTYFANVDHASFVCRLDKDGVDGAPAPCPATGFGAGPLADGDYTFSVAAIDDRGATDPTPDTRTFTISGKGDNFTIAVPATPTRKRSGTISFSTNASLHGIECQLSRSGIATWKPCSPSTGYAYSNLADGRWIFRVRGTNLLAVTTTPASEAYLVVDNVGPTATFSIAPPKKTQSQTADFAFSFPAGNTGPVYCTLDGGVTSSCDGRTYRATGLAEGQHTLVVAAFDELSNKGKTTFGWTVDRTPPKVTPVSPMGTVGPDPLGRIDVDELVSWTFSVDNGPAFDGNPASMRLYSLADGPHSLRYRAVDRAGNATFVKTLEWVQQTPTSAQPVASQASAAPVVTIDGGPAPTSYDDFAVFSFHADQPKTSFECAIDGGGYSNCASGIAYEDLSVGAHRFRVRGRYAGRTGSAAVWEWRVSSG
jgi:arylsulfatase A-like enzyme